MGISIESAYLGDEKSRTNVTNSLRSKITDSGVEVPVDSKLLPMIQVDGTVELNKDELQEAKDKAQTACGGGADATCIEMKTQEFSRQRLAEKENEKTSTANIIKGRRLTVTYKEDGKTRTVEVPEGQVFKIGGEKGVEPTGPTKTIAEKLNLTGTALEIFKVVAIIVSTGLYAFSILITYRSFIQSGYTWQAYAATAVSVLFPYSGFLLVLGWFGIREFIKNMPVKKQ